MALGILGSSEMTIKQIATAATIAATLLTLAGCVSLSKPEPVPTAAGGETSPPWHAPAASDQLADDSLPWDSHADAVAVGEAAMAAFLDRSLPADKWWEAFQTYLTVEGRYVWEGTDPRNIPATEMTAPPTTIGTPTSTRVQLSVPTDAGVYEMTLTRKAAVGSAPGPWKVFELRPPSQTNLSQKTP